MARKESATPALLLRLVITIIMVAITLQVDGSVVARSGLQMKLRGREPPAKLESKTGGLLLPGNATVIRENIVGSFSCKDRIYGYYADMENDCQIFHVCLPHVNSAARWSFICPSKTKFNQATFVCTRTENSIACGESDKFYNLNEAIGKEIEEEEESDLNHLQLNQ